MRRARASLAAIALLLAFAHLTGRCSADGAGAAAPQRPALPLPHFPSHLDFRAPRFSSPATTTVAATTTLSRRRSTDPFRFR
jgi:hypothetical protein